MAVKITWYIPDRVMLTDFSGQTTAQDIKDITAQLPQMLHAGTPPVHWILDIRDEVKPFLDVGILKDTLGFTSSPRMGWIIIVGQTKNALINLMIKITSKIFHTRYNRTETLAEALEFLREKDETLRDAA